jgi:predicted phosphodiesterase
MKLGILADIHEATGNLRAALAVLRRQGAERLVALGDVFETGKHIGETVRLLREAGAVGVWGNHDLGLCHEPTEAVRARYAGPVLDFMGTLSPRLELGGCLFTHGLPSCDPTDPAAYYLGDRPETPEGLEASFAAVSTRVLFVGHFHRWLVASSGGVIPWGGERSVCLAGPARYLLVVHAVKDGWCGVYDTETSELAPLRAA